MLGTMYPQKNPCKDGEYTLKEVHAITSKDHHRTKKTRVKGTLRGSMHHGIYWSWNLANTCIIALTSSFYHFSFLCDADNFHGVKLMCHVASIKQLYGLCNICFYFHREGQKINLTNLKCPNIHYMAKSLKIWTSHPHVVLPPKILVQSCKPTIV